MNISIIKLNIILVVLLPACATTSTVIAKTCSCNAYLEEKPKPDWLNKEVINDKYYLTHGLSHCTGLKAIDIKRADRSAKANLARMVSSQINSRQKLTSGSYGNGVTHNSYTENTEISTNLALEHSSIFERWVDNQTCTVYSAVKMSTESIKMAKDNAKIKADSQLLAQSYNVIPSNFNYLNSALSSTLSDLNVSLSQTKNSIRVQPTVSDIKIASPSLARLKLTLELVDPIEKHSIWKKTYSGKGLSFRQESSEQLTQKAIKNAFKKMKPELIKFLRNNQRKSTN